MSQSTYLITGRVTRADTGQGVHGLQVEAWDEDIFCDDCLGGDLTNRDGSFAISFHKADFHEPFEGDPEIYLKIRDRDGRLIYDTRSEKRTCRPEQPLEFNISLVPDILWWHLTRPLSWEEPTEQLLSAQIFDEIEEAAESISRSGVLRHDVHLPAVLCATPSIELFDNILQDAWVTLQGDLAAAGRYRDALNALCSSQAGACSCHKDSCYRHLIDDIFEEACQEPPEQPRCAPPPEEPDPCEKEEVPHTPDCPCPDTLISREKTMILVMAALHIACGHQKTARRYLQALVDQISRFEVLGALHEAAVKALCGDDPSAAHFHDLMEFVESQCAGDGRSYLHYSRRDGISCCETCLDEDLVQCLREAVNAWCRIACYTVTEVQPARACPGDEIVICGTGFGPEAGQIRFRQKGGLALGPAASPTEWCDDRITVTVPEGAGCGLVPLLPPETIHVCGRFLEYRPTGCIEQDFEGTSAEILKFTVKGLVDGQCLEPGVVLPIRWKTCAADNVKIELINEETGVVIARRDPAEARGSWDFADTNFNSTVRLRVQITAVGQCQPRQVVEEVTFLIQKQPDLSVDGIEVTQAIQFYRANQHLTDTADRGPDNSLRLVTNKTAWVRVYLRSGQDPAFDGGQLTVVDGTLTVSRRVGGVWSVVATIPSQNGPVTARESFIDYDTERGNINNSLNFVVPANVMTGLLRFTVDVASEYADCPGNTASGQTTVDVNLTQTLNAAFITIGYNGPNNSNTGNLNLPAPTLAQCQAETSWAMRTYPVSGAANVRIAGTFVTNTPLNDPRTSPGSCSPNWQPLLQQVANLVAADQAANPGGNWVYYGIINNGIPVNVPGCNGWGATGGLAGRPTTYAHEIGHQFGLPHARCGNVGGGNASYPIYEPYDLPQDPPGTSNWTMASIGEYGLDINNGNIANPNNAEDFMSYCSPRWISVFTHNFLVNAPGLVPQVIPTGSGAATNRVIRDEEPNFERRARGLEPLVHILGRVDADGNVEVTSVARLETRYLVGNGRPTRYLAQLVDAEGNVVAQDTLYRYEALGCGCGCSDCGDCADCGSDKTFLFKAMLDDVAPGDCLRIVKDDEVVWQRNCPAKTPELSRVRARLDKENRLNLNWRRQMDEEAEEDVWVRWSNDDGDTWHALTVGLQATAVDLDLDHLPAGEIKFQIMAHDGFSTVTETTDAITIPARPPVVTILYPREEDPVYAERRLHLWGMASTPAGSDLDDEAFVWSIDGEEVGRGRDIWVDNPGVGKHEVRLTVSGEGGTGESLSVIEIE